MKFSNEQSRRLFDVASALGGEYVGPNGRSHHIFRFPNGNECRVSGSPSDWNGFKNSQLEMERASGRKLPRLVKRRSRKSVQVDSSKRTFAEGAVSEQIRLQVEGLQCEAAAVRDEFSALVESGPEASREEIKRVRELLEAWRLIGLRLEALHQSPLPPLGVDHV